MKKTVSFILIIAILLSVIPFALAESAQASISISDFGTRQESELEKIAVEYKHQLGVILPQTQFEIEDGGSALDLVKKACEMSNITLELHPQWGYVVGIDGFGEYDAGELSGWLFKINGYMGQEAISDTILQDGDVLELVYSCNMGLDLGADFENHSQLLKDLELSNCAVDVNLNPQITSYELTAVADEIFLIGHQQNLNSKVLYFLNGRQIKYAKPIPVTQGDVITVRCFNSAFGSEDYTDYIFNVSVASLVRPRFDDVPEEHWAYDYVTRLAEEGIVNGMSANMFIPESPVARAQFAAFLYRLHGVPQVITGDPAAELADVAEGSWYYFPIRWAMTQEIINGFNDGTFGPDMNITRQDMAVLVYRYLKYKHNGALTAPDTAPEFLDAEHIADYAKEAVAYLYANQIISGRIGNSFDPTGTLTRAEAAKIIDLCGEI